MTLSGVVHIDGDLTVGDSETLTISPGTTIRVRANGDSQNAGLDHNKTEIVANGWLKAVGTAADSIRWTSASATPAPGDWFGIYAYDASTGLTLDYNAIAYGLHGIKVDACTLAVSTITHSTIRHSQFYGVYAYNRAKVSIDRCILEQNHAAEVAAAVLAKLDVRRSFLRYSSSLSGGMVDDGIVYTSQSGGVLRKNRVFGTGIGLYCYNSGSNPTLIGEGISPDSLKYGRNDILDFHSFGILATDNARPDCGSNAPDNFIAGRNDVFSRTYPTATWVKYTQTSPGLNAAYNFWGKAVPDLARFIGNIYGDSTAYLTLFESPAGPNPNQYYPGYDTAGSLVRPAQKTYVVALAA